MLDRWSRGRAAPVEEDVHGPEVFLQEVPIDVFCEQVGGVDCSGHFRECELLQPELLLYPEVGNREMANLAQPAAPTHPYSRCSIGPNVEAEVDVEILGQCT